jgi:Domain of unknown function (DUF4287)
MKCLVPAEEESMPPASQPKRLKVAVQDIYGSGSAQHVEQCLKGIEMPAQEPVKGPASYFPSIEKKYGQPIAHWMQILEKAGPLKHMELVGLLKSEHQLGHGHANALVAWFAANKK